MGQQGTTHRQVSTCYHGTRHKMVKQQLDGLWGGRSTFCKKTSTSKAALKRGEPE